MIELFGSALVTFLVIIDPPGCAPIFASLTRGMSPVQRRSKTMSSAIMNSMTPPAIRKLPRLMPKACSIGLPSKAKNIRIAQAISDERTAIARR